MRMWTELLVVEKEGIRTGRILHEPDNPGKSWRVDGAVGINGLADGLRKNPAMLTGQQVEQAVAVVERSDGYLGYLLKRGGVVLPDGNPQKLNTGLPQHLVDYLKSFHMMTETLNTLREMYQLNIPGNFERNRAVVTIVGPGSDEVIRHHMLGTGLRPGLALSYGHSEHGVRTVIPEAHIHGLTKIPKWLLAQYPDLRQLPFTQSQVIRQSLYDRSQRADITWGT